MKGDTNEQALLKGLAHNDSKAVEIIYKDNFNMIQAFVLNNNGGITIDNHHLSSSFSKGGEMLVMDFHVKELSFERRIQIKITYLNI